MAGDDLAQRFREGRAFSLALAAPLSAEDQQVQPMPDASPTKWHLAHTTWFFETLVLAPNLRGYRPFDPRFAFLFNSYYESLGDRFERPRRGLLTRPSLDEVRAYRRHVDEAAERAAGSRSTTRGRPTTFFSKRSSWARARSPAASTSHSWTTAVTTGPSCGCPTAGRR